MAVLCTAASHSLPLDGGCRGSFWLGTNHVMSDPSGGMILVAVGASPGGLPAPGPECCCQASQPNRRAATDLCRTPKKLSAAMC